MPMRTEQDKITIKQISKFIIVGSINTLIDFLIINIGMFITGITSGIGLVLINSISFLCASVNSYLLNNYWAFVDKKEKRSSGKRHMVKISKFLIISVIGITINNSIVFLITTFIPPVYSLSAQIWANGAKMAATLASLTWNFTGYKFWVFRGRK